MLAAPGRDTRLLVERLGTVVRIVVADERSQARNRDLAVERLRARVGRLRVAPPRRATRPTSGGRRSDGSRPSATTPT